MIENQAEKTMDSGMETGLLGILRKTSWRNSNGKRSGDWDYAGLCKEGAGRFRVIATWHANYQPCKTVPNAQVITTVIVSLQLP